MDYFYCPPENISGNSITIDGDEFSHLTHVMRKKTGDEIRVVDGKGTAYDVRLNEIKKKTASGVILKSYKNHNEPEIAVTLGVGILKNPSKFDFLVEKVSELGVKEIVPLHTERTIPSHAKVDRWQKLALAAMKQSCRSYLPRVREMVSLYDFLSEKCIYDIKLIAHEQEEGASQIQKILTDEARSVVVLIGPEGGFSDDEIDRCLAAGYKQIYFGRRRLRTETAAIVAAAMLIVPSF
jgi:16S rRNA (uracil1498-N3)-methyltransferase